MSLLTCPICDKPFDLETSTTMPFCSDRCRQIDLGRWIDEGYGLQVERAEQPSHESHEHEVED